MRPALAQRSTVFLLIPKHVGDFVDIEGVVKGCESARDAQHLLWRWKRFGSLFSRVHCDTPAKTEFIFSRT